jgi:hypothetical protein
MNDTLTDCIIFGLVLACVYPALIARNKKTLTEPSALDNMERAKVYLIARIRGMKYVEEAQYYKWEIKAFVDSHLFHPDIAQAKETLKNELQMQVNYLSIPQLIG